MRPTDRVTGKDIILDIVENMRAYQEELLYSSMVPTAFEVHLHPDDFDRLEGIFQAISAEARRALDEELTRQNRRIGPQWLWKLAHAPAPAQPAHDSWSITFFRDENEELAAGEVLIDSRLTVPQTPELGTGTRTRRITTSRIGQQTTSKSQIVEEPPAPLPTATTAPLPQPAPPPLPPATPGVAATPAVPAPAGVTPGAPVPPAAAAAPAEQATTRTTPAVSVADAPRPAGAAAGATVYATLTYDDNSGHHTHPVTESQLVIGRGGAGYWVDLRVDAAPDVSREHVRLRRDTSTGRFFLKDLSLYGTTINGERVASSIETSDGAKRDINIEVPLPPVARIGLADMVFLEFRMADAS
jgi:hypothetical protein